MCRPVEPGTINVWLGSVWGAPSRPLVGSFPSPLCVVFVLPVWIGAGVGTPLDTREEM
jgi:hypothetical protein